MRYMRTSVRLKSEDQVMPFSIMLYLGAEHHITFEGWLEDAFGKIVPEGTAFAKASIAGRKGFIAATGRMFLSAKAPLVLGSNIAPGEYIAPEPRMVRTFPTESLIACSFQRNALSLR
jgi:hypothetical protein